LVGRRFALPAAAIGRLALTTARHTTEVARAPSRSSSASRRSVEVADTRRASCRSELR